MCKTSEAALHSFSATSGSSRTGKSAGFGLQLAVFGLAIVTVVTGCGSDGNNDNVVGGNKRTTLAAPSRSTSIAMTSDDRSVVLANRETDTVSVIEVRNAQGQDTALKLAEIPVGLEPRFVAISPDDREVYVSNSVSGSVSVISLKGGEVVDEILVGTEPRGIAVTPNGSLLYVANHTAGTVSVIDTAQRAVVQTVNVGGNPTAIAITSDGDSDDQDEKVFVTQLFAELIPGGPGEVFDDGKQGVVRSFSVANPAVVNKITLAPLADAGFSVTREKFCRQIKANAHSDLFCPDTTITDPLDPKIAKDPQGAFPNLLQSALIRGNRLFLPNIGASPEPPVVFNVNIQGLVSVVDVAQGSERVSELINLNNQIKQEQQPAAGVKSLDRLFSNDLPAIDASADGGRFLIVSRGSNYVMEATLDAAGKLNLLIPPAVAGAKPTVKRFQTGNIPNGVVISHDGRRAYTNNEVGVSVTAIALDSNTVLARDIPSGNVAEPGTFAHSVLMGKLAFFTALGIPDNGFQATPIRDIDPLEFRNHASDNGWSSCNSCHVDGLSDGVTWVFAAGPRQTIPMDAFFAKDNPADQRPTNWSGNRSSITDFNNNSRDVQGGKGFAGDPPNPEIFDHGISQGASDALDVQTLWVQTIRPLQMPLPNDFAAVARGRALFATSCASCHGGAKWSKSQVIYANNPTLASAANNNLARDPGLLVTAGQVRQYTNLGNNQVIRILDDVGTFNLNDPAEIRAGVLALGAATGNDALGVFGFQPPALLSVGYHAPYMHNGAAQTLTEVFPLHHLLNPDGTVGPTITQALPLGDLADIEAFLKTIDGATVPLRSEMDAFREALSN